LFAFVFFFNEQFRFKKKRDFRDTENVRQQFQSAEMPHNRLFFAGAANIAVHIYLCWWR